MALNRFDLTLSAKSAKYKVTSPPLSFAWSLAAALANGATVSTDVRAREEYGGRKYAVRPSPGFLPLSSSGKSFTVRSGEISPRLAR